MKRFLAALLVIALVLPLAVGCGSTPAPTATTSLPTAAVAQPTAAPTAQPTATLPLPTATTVAAVTLTDDLGTEITLLAPPERIVSIAPSVTEILFALGVGDRVVGVSDYTTYPEEAVALPTVGAMPLNFEAIVALRPDLVIGADTTSVDDRSKLESLNLKVLIINKTDLEGLFGNIELLGKATGAQVAAADLVSTMRSDLEALKKETAAATTQPRVYVEIDETLYSVGPGSFIDPLITLAGGTNIAADAVTAWPQLSAEQVIAKDPEIILLADAAYGVTPETVLAREGWSQITAVKTNAVFPVDADAISRPGPRLIKALRQMASLIHPELEIGK